MSRRGGGARGPGRQSAGRAGGGPGRGGPPPKRAAPKPRPKRPPDRKPAPGRGGAPDRGRGRGPASTPNPRGGGAPASGRGPAFSPSPRGGGGPAPGRGRGPAFAPDPRGGGPAPEPPPSGRMVIYGVHPVEEALRGRRKVHRIWATEPGSWGRVSVVSAEEIEERAGSDAHQGVCALVDPYPYVDSAELLAVRDPLLVALDEITDPQNLGAVARTAEGVGATGLVIPERRSAEVTPAVCKASAGAVEHLRIARVRNLADFLAQAKDKGCWVYGASAGASTRYDRPDYTGGVVAVLGAEGRGLRQRVASMCDDLVALPLLGRVESLNVSATAAVLLYEMLQQRLDAST